MSTKTTLKRIALVAVSALGFGLLSAVSVNATGTAKTTMYTTDIAFSTDKTPVAGSLGTSSVHTVTFTSNTTAATTLNPYFVLLSAPATSAMAQENEDGSLSAKGFFQIASGNPASDHDPLARTITSGTAFDSTAMGEDFTYATGTNAAGNYYQRFYIHAWYDVAGTYVWAIRDEANDNATNTAINNGIDYQETFSVVVSGSSSTVAATGTLSAHNSSSTIEATTSGAIVKVGLKDASGNALTPDAGAGVRVKVSGSGKVYKVNGGSAVSVSEYVLGAGDFDGSGIAYLNITNATAETVVVSLENSGFSSFTAPASVSLTFRDASNDATTAAPRTTANGGSNIDTDSGSYYYDATAGSKTMYWTLDDIAASGAYDYVTITDTTGYITGRANLVYTIPVARTSSTVAGSFSVTTTATSGAYSFTVNGGSSVSASAATRATDSITVQVNDSRKAVTASTVSFTVLVKDQFGNARAAQTVTTSIAGRNSTVVVAAVATDADGYATISYKDASTSTTSMVDTITFTSGTKTDTASVTWMSTLGVGTVLLTTDHTDSTGVTELVKTYSDIDAGADGAQDTTETVVATVKDANSVVLSGVPVTFTVSGTGAAVTSTTQTVYTDGTGKASASVYGWIAGTYTVTATAGSVSDTAPINFAQVTTDGTEARNITATVSGGSITAKVTDRFGNPVYDAPVRATRTGTGSFNGVATASGSTDRNGLVEFVLSGGSADVTLYIGSTENYGQSAAGVGLVSSTDALDVFEDYTAGTALEDEVGVGNNVADYTKAGNNSVKVSVTTVDAAATAAEAASDAAAEAIDAANAATDAANLAAEAADAATVAAEEARDAADAATAAVEELATQVATLMAALKAQITTLANTVAKIAKKVKA